MLKPQDLLVVLKIAVRPEPWTFQELADEVGLSLSETHNAVTRAQKAELLRDREPRIGTLLSFLEHGVRHAFYAERGAPTRGMPTGIGAPPLNREMNARGEIPVWPDARGSGRGYALEPLYRSAPHAARRDPELYEVLALVDAVREGRARERKLAMEGLRQRLERPVLASERG